MGSIFFYACLLISIFSVQGRLEPTKLVNNGVFKLQNQHDGRYLTEGLNGNPTKAEGNGAQNQRFTFISGDGNKLWTLVSLASGKPLGGTSWKVSYVGHGKYQFKNTKTGACLQASRTVEVACRKNEPMQRWYVEPSQN